MDTLPKRGRHGPGLYDLIDRLRGEGIINCDTFKKMDKIRDIRNKMIHPKGDISKLYKPTEGERLQIETAKECIVLLMNYKAKKED